MSDRADDLAALRTAATERDWSELQAILTRLLMQMEYYAWLEIALTRAHNHLPLFERDHPEARWTRSLLVGLASYGVAPAELPPEAGIPHHSPGAGNFITALFELARSAERKTPLENRIRFLANAISNVILAELAAYWYGEHPAVWERQLHHGDEIEAETGQTVRQGIYAQFWLDDEVARRDTAAWLEIAAALGKKLKG